MRFALAWMKETAVASTKKPKGPINKRKGTQRTADNTIYKPEHSLDELLEIRENEEAFTMFVKNFLKPVYSTKWKAKRHKQETKRLSDIVTVSDKAFVFLALENNWERWIDINNKAKNAYTASTRGKSTTIIDSNVMPKYTYINKKRTDVDPKEIAPANWKGWNNEGILRFNDLCIKVKDDRREFSTIDKDILAAVEPEENQQRPKKRRKKLTPTVKAFVDSEDDDSDKEDEESLSDKEG